MSTENNGTEEGMLGHVCGICEFHLSYFERLLKKRKFNSRDVGTFLSID